MTIRIIIFFVLLLPGVQVSTAQILHWKQTKGPYGIKDSSVWSLAANSTAVFAATSSGLWRSSDNGDSWISIENGLAAKIVYIVAAKGSELIAGTDSGIFRSMNNGDLWTRANKSLIMDGFRPALVFADNGTMLFASSSSDSLYSSSDDGNTWIESNDFNRGYTKGLWCLAANQTAVFAGTDGSGVYRSLNNGLTWEAVDTAFIDPLTYIDGDIYALATKDQTIFAGTWYGDVHKSVNNGNKGSWSQAGGGLPGMVSLFPNGGLGIHDIVMTGSAIVIATDKWVFLSTNDGDSWIQASDGLPNSLAMNPPYNKNTVSNNTYLFQATSVGLFRADISEFRDEVSTGFSTQQSVPISVQPNPFSLRTTLSFTSAYSGDARVSIFNLLGVEVSRLFSGELGAGEHPFTWDASEMPRGIYICVARMKSEVKETRVILIH